MNSLINEQTIPHIEKALGIKLYEHQKNYLLDKGPLQGGRVTGKTTAYCIKLSLSIGEPLNLREPENFADEWTLANHYRYSRSFFRNEFIKIREKLQDYGFPVRRVEK